MSLVHADNFNIYGTTTDPSRMQDGVYVHVGGTVEIADDPDGVSLSKVLMLYTSFDPICRYALKNPTETVGIAQRVWLAGLPDVDGNTILPATWRSDINEVIAYYQITNTGSIKAYVRDATDAYVLVGDTVTPVVTSNGWWHIEAAFTASEGGTGTFEVRVEGVTVIDAETITSKVGTIFSVAQTGDAGGGGGKNYYCKDYVIWDGDGSANNTFIGACIVAELTPTADVTAGGWTSTGTDIYGVLDNNPPSDASYISADDTPPAACEVSLSNLPADVTSVKGLISIVRAAKVDGGDGQLQNSIKSGADLSAGADRPITAAQLYWADVHELDPATSAAWTPGAVDAATLVIDRTV